METGLGINSTLITIGFVARDRETILLGLEVILLIGRLKRSFFRAQGSSGVWTPSSLDKIGSASRMKINLLFPETGFIKPKLGLLPLSTDSTSTPGIKKIKNVFFVLLYIHFACLYLANFKTAKRIGRKSQPQGRFKDDQIFKFFL